MGDNLVVLITAVVFAITVYLVIAEVRKSNKEIQHRGESKANEEGTDDVK